MLGSLERDSHGPLEKHALGVRVSFFAARRRDISTGLRPPDSIGRSCTPILKKILHVPVPESAST